MLNSDFLSEELHVALVSMQDGMSLGMDGLPCEFYKVMWDTFGDDFWLPCEYLLLIVCLSFLTRG